MSSILRVDDLQDSGGNSILSSNGSGTFTNNANDIKVADLWLLTSSFQGDANPISSNFSKAVSVTSNVTTESSGIFSFPLTGFYMVTWNVVIRLDSGDEKGNWYTRFTTVFDPSFNFFNTSESVLPAYILVSFFSFKF